MKIFKLLVFLTINALLYGTPVLARANTPGQHSNSLSWTASTTTGVTYNLYRGPAAGVCSGTPTPYKTGLTTTSFVDTANLSDGQITFYNVSAINSTGGESACNGELQLQTPVFPQTPSGLTGNSK